MLNESLTQDLGALLPGQSTEQGATRRTALKAAIGVGYAAAAMPIMASLARWASASAALLKAPLTLTSTLGRGSVFSIEVCRAQHELPAAMDTPHAERRSHGRLDGALVAVIDDEPLILDATALVLRRWGCLVVTATSGQEAVAQLSLSDRVPDVIVCDHRLQGTETGIDVIAAIRSEFNSDIPAVLITGDTSPQRIQSILTTGIPVLNKPLQDHVLMDALLRLLNQLPMA